MSKCSNGQTDKNKSPSRLVATEVFIAYFSEWSISIYSSDKSATIGGMVLAFGWGYNTKMNLMDLNADSSLVIAYTFFISRPK